MKGRQLDLTSESNSEQSPEQRDRSFLGVHFVCCDVYTRVYISQDQAAYVGNCPKCGRHIQFQVGAGGTDHRFFRAN